MRHNVFVCFLFLVLSAAFGTVLARPEGGSRTLVKRSAEPFNENWTNAERLARGLAPRKPRSLYTPTRVAARGGQSRPSGIPQQVTGSIMVKRNGASLGYLKKSLLSNGRYTLTTSTSNSVRASFKFTPGTSPFNIEINDNANYEYLGLVDPTNRNFLARTNPTSPNARPSNVGNSATNGQSQSAVWSYNPGSGKLTAQYVKTNGDVVTGPSAWYRDDGSNEGLGVGSKPSNADDVEFFFVQA